MSRYGAILSKFGLGLTPAQFVDAQVAGDIIGHHGFEQTIGGVAAGLEWEIDQIEVDPVVPSIVSQTTRIGNHVTIESGQISAVTHAARGVLAGEAVVDLEILFGFFDEGDEVTQGDDYRIVGVDQVIVLSSDVGFESFLSTIAVAVNTSAAVVSARPGLLSMGDISPLALASKGAMLSVEQPA